MKNLSNKCYLSKCYLSNFVLKGFTGCNNEGSSSCLNNGKCLSSGLCECKPGFVGEKCAESEYWFIYEVISLFELSSNNDG